MPHKDLLNYCLTVQCLEGTHLSLVPSFCKEPTGLQTRDKLKKKLHEMSMSITLTAVPLACYRNATETENETNKLNQTTANIHWELSVLCSWEMILVSVCTRGVK